MERGNKDLNRRIARKIRQIAESFTNNRFVPHADPGLFCGKTGLALFLFNYSLEHGDQRKYNKAARLIHDVVNKDLVKFSHPSFSEGIAGIAWATDFINENKFMSFKLRDFFDKTDKLVFMAGKEYVRDNNWDYLHSAIGTGLYFLKRDTKFSNEYLEFLVNELYSKAIFFEGGIYWKSYIDSEKSSGINLGLAHGLPGILIFLSKIYLKGINIVKTIRLIQGIIDFFDHCKQDNNAVGSYYPNWIMDLQKPERGYSRLAWCYGDIGVGLSIFFGGQSTGNDSWKSKGLEILKETTKRRDLKTNFIIDAGFCHGSAGLAHVYRKLFDITEQNIFKKTSDYWVETTLELATFHDGVAGYKSCLSIGHAKWVIDTGLLEGISGIGLTLMYCLNGQDPAWDECMMLS